MKETEGNKNDRERHGSNTHTDCRDLWRTDGVNRRRGKKNPHSTWWECVPTLRSSRRAQDSDERVLVQQQVKPSHYDPEQQHTQSLDAPAGRKLIVTLSLSNLFSSSSSPVHLYFCEHRRRSWICLLFFLCYLFKCLSQFLRNPKPFVEL